MALYEVSRDGARREIGVEQDEGPPAFSFFVPCYNEEANISSVLRKLVSACEAKGVTYEILVFDDSSKDGTVNAVKAFRDANTSAPVRLFVNSTNQGVARNFIDGAFQARGQYFRVVMGDDVESEETHLSIIGLAGQADIVIPYYSRITGRPLLRKIISRLYTLLVNMASNRRLKYYNGSPLFLRRDALRFHVEATGLGFQAEFLLRLLQEGRSFVEVGVVGYDREGSTSLNLRNFVSVGYSIFKIFVRRISGKGSYISE